MMNKRIQELAEQAWDATAVSPEFGHPVSFAEKFAELIVQECMSVVDSLEGSHHIPWVNQAIKKHFEVEE